MTDSEWNKMVNEVYEGMKTSELNKEVSELHYEISNKFDAVDALKDVKVSETVTATDVARASSLADDIRSHAIAMTKRSKRINEILEKRKDES